MKLLSLRSGRLGLDLAPQAGGSIARFTADGSIDLLRPTTPEAVASGRGNESSCYPLVPFSGRIADGRFVFDGTEIVLKPNWPGVRHPMHGDGWAKPWTVARSDDHSAEIVYEHDAREGWPFRYRARQTYRLDGDALSDVSVQAKIVAHERGPKLRIVKFKPKRPPSPSRRRNSG